VTQLATASSTLDTPNPTTEPAADPTAPLTPWATVHTVPIPVAPSALIDDGHTAEGTAGNPTRAAI
jgi:hypothetical protein